MVLSTPSTLRVLVDDIRVGFGQQNADWGYIFQWVVVGFFGISLGVYVLVASSLPRQWAVLSVLLLLYFFLAMVVGNVERSLLAIIILDIPFQLDINLAYRAEAGALGALGGLNISVTTIALALLYVFWSIRLLTRIGLQQRPLFTANLPLALYTALVTLSLVVAQDVVLASFEVFLLCQMFLLYVYVTSSVRNQRDVLFIVTLLLVGLILESVTMIGIWYTGQDLDIAGVSSLTWAGSSGAGQFSRSGGTVGSPNTAASYVSLLLGPAIGLLLTRTRRWYKWVAILAFGLGSVSLILTLSRGGWLASIFSIAVICLLAWHRGQLSLSVPVAIGIVIILLALPFQDAIVSRLSGDNPAHPRTVLNKLAFRMIEDHPLFGVGANNFAVAVKQYAAAEFSREWLYVVHNKYLHVWAEAGIAALIAFIAFLVATVQRGWQCWKSNEHFLSPLALGITAAILGHMIHMFVDVFNSRPLIQLLWLSAGLITTLHRLASTENVEDRVKKQRYGFDLKKRL